MHATLSDFLLLYFDAVSGRQISYNLVGQMIQDVNLRAELGISPIVILILGSNNLRNGGDPMEVADLFRDFIENILLCEKTHVILTGIITSHRTDESSKKTFSKLSKELKKISNKYRYKCSFINTSKLFVSHNVLNTEFYSDDGLHLNPMGACKLAGGLWAALRNIFL